jgi:DNA mismatch repair ATPase MutS
VICEQIETLKSGGLVKRDVVEIITPGTVIDQSLIEGRAMYF